MRTDRDGRRVGVVAELTRFSGIKELMGGEGTNLADLNKGAAGVVLAGVAPRGGM